VCSSKASWAAQMIDYPFADFVADYEAIAPLLRRKRPKSFEGLFFRVSKQMHKPYPNADRAHEHERAKFLILIAQYVSEHMDDFDTGDFAVVGSAKVGALVSNHLLQAVHKIFTETPLSKLGRGPDAEDVKRLALTLRDS